MRYRPLIIAVMLLSAIMPAFAQSSSSSGSDASSPAGAAQSSPGPTAAAKPSAGPGAPDEPEILLPEMILKIEDVTAEDISSALPPSTEIAVPDISTPLPDQGDLHVPDSAFEVNAPDTGASSGTARPSNATLFSTGVLGAGTMDHILGSVALYKLGDAPRFRLGFMHEGLDGFADNAPGTGFFSGTNSIDGWVSLGNSEKTLLDTSAAFNEQETGLQNQSDYYSAKIQSLTGTVALTGHPDPLVAVGATLDGGLATRLLSVSASAGANAVAQSEYRLAPELTASLNLPSFTAQLQGGYDLRLTDSLPTLQSLSASLGFDASLPASLVLKMNGGIDWPIGESPRYPFGIEFSGTMFQSLTATLSGGYSVIPQRLALLWPEFPMLSLANQSGGPLQDGTNWNGKLDLGWNTFDQVFSADAAFAVEYRENVLDIIGYSRTNNEFTYNLSTLLTMAPSVRLRWSPLSTFALTLGWNGNLHEKANQEPWQTFSMDAEVNNLANRIGGSLNGTLDIFDAVAMPQINVAAHVDVSDGVQLRLEGQDLLAPFLSGGRPIFGAQPSFSGPNSVPFIQPGIRITLSTHISL